MGKVASVFRQTLTLILLGLMGILAVPVLILLAVLYVFWTVLDFLTGKKTE